MTAAEAKRLEFAENYVSAFCTGTAANHVACKGIWGPYGLTPALACRCGCHAGPPPASVVVGTTTTLPLPPERCGSCGQVLP